MPPPVSRKIDCESRVPGEGELFDEKERDRDQDADNREKDGVADQKPAPVPPHSLRCQGTRQREVGRIKAAILSDQTGDDEHDGGGSPALFNQHQPTNEAKRRQRNLEVGIAGDPQYDVLADKARVLVDDASRTAALKDLMNYIYDQAPGAWTILQKDPHAYKTSVIAGFNGNGRPGSTPTIFLDDMLPAS